MPPDAGMKQAAILLFHGGGWQAGDASWVFARANRFAAKGVVAIAIDYRLALKGLSPVEAVEDACAAFAWTRAHARELRIDPKKVAGYGVSAGGHLVASAALLPMVGGRRVQPDSRPNALLLYSPALNMARDGFFVGLMRGHGDPGDYSPAEFVNRSLPPAMIIQGEKDTLVRAKDAEDFCAKAKTARARCELHVYPGVGHLLTRNLASQEQDFDPDPVMVANAHALEDSFLEALGYVK